MLLNGYSPQIYTDWHRLFHLTICIRTEPDYGIVNIQELSANTRIDRYDCRLFTADGTKRSDNSPHSFQLPRQKGSQNLFAWP